MVAIQVRLKLLVFSYNRLHVSGLSSFDSNSFSDSTRHDFHPFLLGCLFLLSVVTLRISMLLEACFFLSFLGVGALSIEPDVRFIGVAFFLMTTPDLLSRLPLLIVGGCVLSATVFVLNNLYLFRFAHLCTGKLLLTDLPLSWVSHLIVPLARSLGRWSA